MKIRPSGKTIRIADLFCGAGGTSTGALEAAVAMGLRPSLTAVNHWPVAVQTHTNNHPEARHLCASLDSVNPRELFKEGELDLLWASPECMSHSVARGGRPVNDQSRATAWCVLRWADALRPPVILVENVPEFADWAPIGSGGRPLRSRRGEVFEAWCESLRSLGYTVAHKVLCAADYGDPTTRRRLFVQAVRGRRKIVWPLPTHARPRPAGEVGLFAQARPWTPARRIIDWTLRGGSIFERKRPLSDKTLRRIFAGLERFGLKPFLTCMEHGGSVRSADRPMPTVTTARGGAIALAEPFLVKLRGTGDGQVNNSAQSIDVPAPTVTGGGRHLGLVEPFLVQVNHGNGKDGHKGNGRRTRSVDTPMPTVCGTRGEWAVCEPFIVPNFGERDGQKPRVHSINDPAPAVTGHGAGALIEPMILPQHSGGRMRSVNEPAPTVTTTSRGVALLEPFLVSYYGNGRAESIDEPVDTVTCKDRFGLVRPVVELKGERYELDILYRMLQPHELAGAQGFRPGYQFSGTKTEVVKQIGNAVPRRLARAIVAASLSQDPDVDFLCDDEPDGKAVA